jgi:hypothetical protein
MRASSIFSILSWIAAIISIGLIVVLLKRATEQPGTAATLLQPFYVALGAMCACWIMGKIAHLWETGGSKKQ